MQDWFACAFSAQFGFASTGIHDSCLPQLTFSHKCIVYHKEFNKAQSDFSRFEVGLKTEEDINEIDERVHSNTRGFDRSSIYRAQPSPIYDNMQ